MGFDALNERLLQLEHSVAQLQDLIARLASLDFRHGAVPLPPRDAGIDDVASNADANPDAEHSQDIAQELAGEINTAMAEQEEEVELLAEELLDMKGGRPGSEAEHERDRIGEGIRRVEGDLKSCRLAFRKAQLQSRAALEVAQRKERALLLSSYAVPPPSTTSGTSTPPSSSSQQQQQHQQQQQQQQQSLPKRRHHRTGGTSRHASATVNASSDVTLALRQTHALIASEVAKSDFAARTLAESTAALSELGERYTDLGGMLRRSRELVSGLIRANKSDTWYLTTAAYMLAATLGWIVFRRLLYGPAWWLVWLPLRLILGTGWKVGSGAVGGLRSGQGMEEGGVDGARMLAGKGQVGGEKVVGITEGAVPTISSSSKGQRSVDQGAGEGHDEDRNLMEEVGRIIDGVQDDQGVEGQQDIGATMVMEEEEMPLQEPERLRDEL